MAAKRIQSWWFASSDRLPYGDDRKIYIGKTHSLAGKIIICLHALHGSIHPYDALQYATGPYLYKVEQWGDLIQKEDKMGSRHRKYLMKHDITEELCLFARRQALSVIHLWNAPDIVKEYLETGEESLKSVALSASAAYESTSRFARAAAWATADSVAWSAVRSAVRSAARSAAKAESAKFAAQQNFKLIIENKFIIGV